MIPAFLVDVDFSKQKLLNPVFQVLASAPASPVQGQFYFNSTLSKFGYYKGAAWTYWSEPAFQDGGAITWTISGDSITLNIADATTSLPGLFSAADKTKLNAATSTATSGTIVLRDGAGSIAVNNIAASTGTVGSTASNPTDIVNLQTLLNYVSTGSKYKEPVRVAVSTNVATLSGTGTYDGVTVVAGDKILLYGQTTASLNGLYTVAAGAWARTADLPAASRAAGSLIIVTEGTVNADSMFVCTTDSTADVVGTNNLSFNRFPNSIQVDNTSIYLNSGVLAIKAGGVGTAELAASAVTTAKIADANVTTSKIADTNVTTPKIADSAVTAAKIATAAVDGTTIAGGAGTALKVNGYTYVPTTTVQRVITVSNVVVGGGSPVNVPHPYNTLNIAEVTVRDSTTKQPFFVDWTPNAVGTVAIISNITKTVDVTIEA